MYSRGKRRLDELESKLAALRAEARGGYGREEVRRNRIKADLEAERLAKERAVRERFLRLTRDDAAAATGDHARVASVIGTTMVDLDAEEATASQRQCPAPYEVGDITDLILSGGGGDGEGHAITDATSSRDVDAVMAAAQQQLQAYAALIALTDDYDYDDQWEAKQRQVQARDVRTGLPVVLSAGQPRSAQEDLVGEGASSTADLFTPPPPPGPTSTGSPYVQPASPHPRLPHRESRHAGSLSRHRSGSGTSAASSRRTAPRAPAQASLSTQGTAVAVSYGQSHVRALQKLVRARRQVEAASSTAPRGSRATSLSSALSRPGTTATENHASAWPPLTETVSRVVRPTVVVFCPHCTRLFETDLLSATAISGEENSAVPTAAGVLPDGCQCSCPHCGSAAHPEAAGAWWATAPAEVLRVACSSSIAQGDVASASLEPARVVASSHAVSGGTDSVGFPDDDDDGESFQAALAQVRAAIAASKQKEAASAAQPSPPASAETATQHVDAAPDAAELAKKWSDSLRGVLLMHLWDVQETAP